jgi:hypothetical protein
MKKICLGLIASAFGLGFMSSAAVASTGMSSNDLKNIPASQNKTSNPSYLFIMRGVQGTIKINKDKSYTLSMMVQGENPVKKFTQHPDRDVSYISLNKFNDIWHSGVDDFVKNPPNAVLAIKDITLGMPVELSNMKLDGKMVSFDLKALSGGPQVPTGSNLKSVSLIIDNGRGF